MTLEVNLVGEYNRGLCRKDVEPGMTKEGILSVVGEVEGIEVADVHDEEQRKGLPRL